MDKIRSEIVLAYSVTSFGSGDSVRQQFVNSTMIGSLLSTSDAGDARERERNVFRYTDSPYFAS